MPDIPINVVVNVFGNFSREMKAASAATSDWSANIRKTMKAQDGATAAMNEGTRRMKWFKMEMLGVMFFGMGIQRFFAQYTKDAYDAFGLTDRLRLSLFEMTMLAIDPFVDSIHELYDAIDKLPDEVKTTIGVIIIGAETLGTFLFTIGMMSLGLTSLAKAAETIPILGIVFTALTSPIKLIAGFFGLASFSLAGFLVVVGILIVILALLAIAWSKNSEGITQALEAVWRVVESVFKSIGDIIGGFVDFLTGVMELDAEKAFNGLKKIFKGAVDFIKLLFFDLPVAILNVFLQIGAGIGIWLTELPAFIAKFAGKIWNAFLSLIPEPFGSLFKVLTKGAGGAIGGFLKGLGIPGFQHGGIVTGPTLAMVGEGGPEAIMPLGSPGFGNVTISPVYTVNASVSNDMDLRELAVKLNDYLVSDYRRLRFR